MVASVSSSSSPCPYPAGSSRSSTVPADPADRFDAAVAADAAAARAAEASSGESTTATTSAVATGTTTPTGTSSSSTETYRIDPSRVHRLAPPTRDGVATLAAELAAKLDAAFAKAGLPTTPPVAIAVDETGVHVSGVRSSGADGADARDDLAAIADLLASDVDLRRGIKMAHSITAQAYALEQTKPEDSYRNVGDPRAAIDSFLAMMEAQRAVSMQFVYADGGVSVTANGIAWPTASEPTASEPTVASEPAAVQAA
ncbi:hypothetical protein [Rhodoplanes azumiensis]|uniref:Uncharacterized protein n=1 Tax=Rhodoplanes azumiensis TaxID=1897628 RepID=A0ABW5AG22_9BRAD